MAVKTTEDTPLTAKQEAFIKHYLESFNGKDAAIKAGYTTKNAPAVASRLLRTVNVAKVLKEKQQELAENLGMSRQEQMDKLNEIYRRRKPNPMDRMKLKIIEMQNKMLGFDVPKPADEKNTFKIVEIPVPVESYKGTREIDE